MAQKTVGSHRMNLEDLAGAYAGMLYRENHSQNERASRLSRRFLENTSSRTRRAVEAIHDMQHEYENSAGYGRIEDSEGIYGGLRISAPKVSNLAAIGREYAAPILKCLEDEGVLKRSGEGPQGTDAYTITPFGIRFMSCVKVRKDVRLLKEGMRVQIEYDKRDMDNLDAVRIVYPKGGRA